MKESKGFNAATGTSSEGYSRGTNKYAGNQSGLTGVVNAGRGPTKGNQDYDSRQGAHREPPTSGLPASTKIKNPDYINGGAQVRTPGGTRSWEPKAGQNYKGNANSINVGRGPTKGNQE
jgi:hypothetical protein